MWVLILFIYAGAMSSGDSVTVTSVDGFQSQQACQAAGKQSMTLTSGTYKDTKFVCVTK